MLKSSGSWSQTIDQVKVWVKLVKDIPKKVTGEESEITRLLMLRDQILESCENHYPQNNLVSVCG